MPGMTSRGSKRHTLPDHSPMVRARESVAPSRAFCPPFATRIRRFSAKTIKIKRLNMLPSAQTCSTHRL
jgi:hypothetical protein